MILSNVVGAERIRNLLRLTESLDESPALRRRSGAVFAARNLLSVPEFAQLASQGELADLAAALVGGRPIPVRGIFFDKNPGANWSVVWHQDTSIAVRERIEVPGFGPWSVKAGVTHVRPPAAILEAMVTLRLHLDDCDESNGPLEVIPGSHLQGLIPESEIAAHREQSSPVACTVGAGGVVAMKPLILHASSPATRPGHRRVIHVEYAADELPGGLRWWHG